MCLLLLHHSVCYVLLVVFCCSLYPRQVQTRMKQVDKKRFLKQVKRYPKLIRRASKIEACGLFGAILAPRQLRTAKMTFLGRSRPPQKEPFWKPFRCMLPSRGALRLKIEDFVGVLGSKNICLDFQNRTKPTTSDIENNPKIPATN